MGSLAIYIVLSVSSLPLSKLSSAERGCFLQVVWLGTFYISPQYTFLYTTPCTYTTSFLVPIHLLVHNTNTKREHAIKRETDQESKSGLQAPLVHTVHTSVGLARFTWDEYSYGEGSRTTCQNDYEELIDVANSELSKDSLLRSGKGLINLAIETMPKIGSIQAKMENGE